MRRLAQAVLLLCVLAVPAAAHAHRFSVRRAMMFETEGAERLHVLATIVVPAGRARLALLALADLDKDGRIGQREEKGLESILVARALDGVKLYVGSATVGLSEIDVKLKVPPATTAPIELMLHGVAALDPREVKVGVTTEPFGDELGIKVLPGSRPVLETSRGSIRRGGFSTSLKVADELWWRIGPPG